MKVDTGINLDLHHIPDAVKAIEAQGYDGVRTAEMNHDPFFPLLLAAEHSEKLEIASSIAVAFARSPMNLAISDMISMLTPRAASPWVWGLRSSRISPSVSACLGVDRLHKCEN